MKTGRPKRLRNGQWGACVDSASVEVGEQVQIVTRAGKTWTATVVKVLWSGDGSAIVATQGDRPRRRRSRRGPHYYSPATGAVLYQNPNGRCEDAPCCGCCT